MTVISTVTDPEALTMTVTARFAASPERVWAVCQDARQLERWWGPPTYPATFTRHDFEVGGESRYFMTGPEGDTPHGWWRMYLIDEPRRLEFARRQTNRNLIGLNCLVVCLSGLNSCRWVKWIPGILLRRKPTKSLRNGTANF